MITSKQLMKIREMNQQGMTDAYIASYLGVTRTTIKRHRDAMGLPAHHRGSGWYTVRNAFGTILANGTSRQCAAELGISLGTFYQRVIRSNREKDDKYVNESKRR